jgi:hypothetical protein
MAEVIYPAELRTDYEKLGAVYSLIEQMRLEHNRQGAIARGDWGTYRGKWQEYTEIFKSKQLLLLQEQNRLRDSIRKAHYSDQEWMASRSNEELGAISEQLFGDRLTLKNIETEATSFLLDELKAIDLLTLQGDAVDPVEDFMTYTEDDSSGLLTVTSNKIAWSNLTRGDYAAVYKSFGSGHFGDLEHKFTFRNGTYSGNLTGAVIWSVADDYHSEADMANADNGIRATAYRYYSTNLYFRDESNGNFDEVANMFFNNTTYYITVAQSGTTATFSVYYDPDRTNLRNTASITTSGATYEYLNALCAQEYSGSTICDGYLEDLDLQETTATEKTSSDSGTGQDIKSEGNPTVMAVSAETGNGTGVKTDYPGAVIGGEESGAGEETASLVVATDTAEDSGGGIETSHLNTGETADKVGSDTGDGLDITTVIFTEIVVPETGSGADAVNARSLKMVEDGFGIETGERTTVWIVADNGSGIEAAAVIPVFGASDAGLGADLSILFKGAQSGDIAYGADTLRALIGAAGLSPDMRLSRGSGRVKMTSKKARRPSKGVNI